MDQPTCTKHSMQTNAMILQLAHSNLFTHNMGLGDTCAMAPEDNHATTWRDDAPCHPVLAHTRICS